MSVIWFFYKIPQSITISIKISRQELFIDMLVDEYIFNSNQSTDPSNWQSIKSRNTRLKNRSNDLVWKSGQLLYLYIAFDRFLKSTLSLDRFLKGTLSLDRLLEHAISPDRFFSWEIATLSPCFTFIPKPCKDCPSKWLVLTVLYFKRSILFLKGTQG